MEDVLSLVWPERAWLDPQPSGAHAPHVTLRSYLKLLNIKANHRKVFATEQTAILSSANPHDASAYHSNAGLEVRGAIIRDILHSEQAVVNLINGPTLPEYSVQAPETGSIQVQLLTEGAIKTHTRRAIAASQPGDVVWLAMFYLADYDILKDLVKVAERGVEVRIILDPNENAFGKGKIGIPNRPVAADLVQRSDGRIQVRWFDIWHNQFHTKLLCIQGSVLTTLIGGSANFTRRSFENHNLEANLKVVAPSTSDVAIQAIRYMERIWNNEDALFTHPYESFSDSLTPVKNVIYYLQEWLRLTTY
jgi:phosphatidylserine/phosphatidylglycerophosphate/cardiolipin synthase-like enzyme